jgi:hypothetical protein
MATWRDDACQHEAERLDLDGRLLGQLVDAEGTRTIL